MEGLAHGQAADGVDIVVGRQGELLEVVGALHAPGGLAGRLDGGQQQRDQDAGDGDDHQQFDQGEAAREGRAAIRIGHGETPRKT